MVGVISRRAAVEANSIALQNDGFIVTNRHRFRNSRLAEHHGWAVHKNITAFASDRRSLLADISGGNSEVRCVDYARRSIASSSSQLLDNI
jgi:hypothetical protein